MLSASSSSRWVRPERDTVNSFNLDPCRLDDRRPFGDLALDQIRQSLRSAPFLVREIATEIEQAFARALVIERLVERRTELVDDRLGRTLGREQRIPRRGLKLGQP